MATATYDCVVGPCCSHAIHPTVAELVNAYAGTQVVGISGMIHEVAAGRRVLPQEVAIASQWDRLKGDATFDLVPDHLDLTLEIPFSGPLDERQSAVKPSCRVVMVIAILVDHLVRTIAIDRIGLAGTAPILVAVVSNKLSGDNFCWIKSSGGDGCKENLDFIGGKFFDLIPVILKDQINKRYGNVGCFHTIPLSVC